MGATLPVTLPVPVPVFWCEPTGKIRRYLRCYQSRSEKRLPCAPGVTEQSADPAPACRGSEYAYCNAMRVLDEVEREFEERDGQKYGVVYDPKKWPWDAFPVVCEACGTAMDAPERQIFTDEIFVVKTGERAGQEFVRRDLPVGAMWHQAAYEDIPDWCGPDGLSVFVMTPGGEWGIDMRANNCTKPGDKVHRCWVRHGDPRTGYVHVDKNGTPERPTCDAGTGSIWMGKGGPKDWHGFLHRGHLTDCSFGGREAVDRMLDGGNPVAPAERVLPAVRVDRPVTVRPVVPPAVPGGRRPGAQRAMTFAEAVARRRAAQTWRSNRR